MGSNFDSISAYGLIVQVAPNDRLMATDRTEGIEGMASRAYLLHLVDSPGPQIPWGRADPY